MTDTIHQVSFDGVKESYILEHPIQCSYVFNETFSGSGRDWIGLYKVGWRSCDSYETYVWVQLPAQSSDGENAVKEGIVTFQAENLPKDSKEFYQFCYVSSAKTVCGVSTPFQLTSAIDDYIEIQDPDDSTTILIKTKSQLAEDNLNKLTKAYAEMEKELKLLQLELDAERTSKGQLIGLLQDQQQLEEELKAEQEKNMRLDQEVKVKIKMEEDLKAEQEKNMRLDQEVKVKIKLEQELKAEQDKNMCLDQEVKELQQALQAERCCNDQLHMQLRALRDELKAEREVQEKTSGITLEAFTGASSEVVENPEELNTEEKQIITSEVAEAEINKPEESGMAISATGLVEDKTPSITQRFAGSLLKHLKRASDWFAEDFDDDDCAAGSASGQQDLNKTDESLKVCPVCSETFSEDVAEISKHVEKHNGQVCPICFMQFDQDYPPEMVTEHVNRHLDSPDDPLQF